MVTVPVPVAMVAFDDGEDSVTVKLRVGRAAAVRDRHGDVLCRLTGREGKVPLSWV